MRLIDADALTRGIKEQKLLAREDAAQRILCMIDEATTFVFPERSAEWLNFAGDFSTAECSECGELYEPSDYRDEEHFNAFKQFYKYCPNCGAKMNVCVSPITRQEAEAALKEEKEQHGKSIDKP